MPTRAHKPVASAPLELSGCWNFDEPAARLHLAGDRSGRHAHRRRRPVAACAASVGPCAMRWHGLRVQQPAAHPPEGRQLGWHRRVDVLAPFAPGASQAQGSGKAAAGVQATHPGTDSPIGGRSMSDVVQGLRSYMLGWKGHFQLAQTPKVWRRLDEWLRCRLRAIQLRNWKRGATMYRELPKLGGTPLVAKQVAANGRRWWRNSDRLLKTIMTIGYFDQLGVPRLS